MAPYFFGIILSVMALFLVLLVLVQRGRGGGLTGALGGVGGSSAFGAKAGDVFTKITVVAAFIWIVTCVGAAYWSKNRSDLLGNQGPALVAPSADASSSEQVPLADSLPASEGATTTTEDSSETSSEPEE